LRNDVYDPTKPFNEQTRSLIVSTHPQEGPIVVKPFGKRFNVERDAAYWKDFLELSGTDGIGTKGLLHWKMGTEHYGVQDAFAMVVDDLIEGGYIPVLLQDHILMQTEDKDRILKAVKALTDLAVSNQWQTLDGKRYPMIITGGETAIIDTLQGFEMGITGTGYVKKGNEILTCIKKGDVIIGIGSSGIHSNGLSFYRRELFTNRNLELDHVLPWGVTIGEELTRPTTVYLPALKDLIAYASKTNGKANDVIHGMVHITGGGLSKLTELLPKTGNLDIEVNREHALMPHPIFRYAYELGIRSRDMYTRFNNGIGYVVAVENAYANKALRILRNYFQADVIGVVKDGSGKVLIESAYESVTLKY
jgi:phosphoribosylformylglycinamidine cyclo-ligase